MNKRQKHDTFVRSKSHFNHLGLVVAYLDLLSPDLLTMKGYTRAAALVVSVTIQRARNAASWLHD